MRIEIVEDTIPEFRVGQTVRITKDIDVMFAKGTTAEVVEVGVESTTGYFIVIKVGQHRSKVRWTQIEVI